LFLGHKQKKKSSCLVRNNIPLSRVNNRYANITHAGKFAIKEMQTIICTH
jgi:hypothetical protein